MDKSKAPMICGGIYEWSDRTKSVIQGTLVSLTMDVSGRTVGVIHSTGMAPERVNPDSERWEAFKLIGRPASPSVGRPKKKG